MDVRRFLVQVNDGVEYPYVRIALLESLNEVGQGFRCDSSFGRSAMGVLRVADLEDHLIKRLLLLAVVDMFIVVFDATVFSLLTGVVIGESLIEKFVIDRLNVLTHQRNIFVCAALIDVWGYEHTIVVTDTALVDTSADRSFYMHFSFRGGAQFSWKSAVTTNAKILLSLLGGATKAFAAAVPLHPFWSGCALPCGIGLPPDFLCADRTEIFQQAVLADKYLSASALPAAYVFHLALLHEHSDGVLRQPRYECSTLFDRQHFGQRRLAHGNCRGIFLDRYHFLQ